MVIFELNKIENGVYYYNYYPQGNMDASGLITITEDGQRGIVKISDDDVQNIYAGTVWRWLSKSDHIGTVKGELPMF